MIFLKVFFIKVSFSTYLGYLDTFLSNYFLKTYSPSLWRSSYKKPLKLHNKITENCPSKID